MVAPFPWPRQGYNVKKIMIIFKNQDCKLNLCSSFYYFDSSFRGNIELSSPTPIHPLWNSSFAPANFVSSFSASIYPVSCLPLCRSCMAAPPSLLLGLNADRKQPSRSQNRVYQNQKKHWTQQGKTRLAGGKDPARSISKGGRLGDLEQRTKTIKLVKLK